MLATDEQPNQRTYASADHLTSGVTLQEDDHKLDDGTWVRIRALSRAEVLRIQAIGRDKALELERHTVSAGLVIPRMTVEQVATWQGNDAAGGDIGRLMEHIRDLSGLGEGAAKAAYKSA
jgi:hypothetical protein